ncbi:MAG: hypothetical protein Q8922_02730 [Bacteroidota bacterium]|nr:hypothetical protein [Bacteroidota bacterium]MDP4232881.1 hypothetical protein [Bacteroidota bacterium]MDP4241925.1 hypothetical protein [Bacteroidota bacterium]MDP4286828.1 hypothetical protein [Bacteroidota bacterium]
MKYCLSIVVLLLGTSAIAQTEDTLSYYVKTGHHLFRPFPSTHTYHSSATGNDTTERIRGLAEKFTSPFAPTYLDSLDFDWDLPNYLDLPNNNYEVAVTGSHASGSGYYPDWSNRFFEKTYHPNGLNNGTHIIIHLPHIQMDTAFFVALLVTDTSSADIRMGIRVDSLTYPELQARDENRDRGREIGVNKSFYMAGLTYGSDTVTRWYSNPMYVAYVSNASAGVASMTSSGFRLTSSFPNPARDEVTLDYSLPASIAVVLRVFDDAGHLVLNDDKGFQSAGDHKFVVSTSSLQTGAFHYQLSAGQESLTGHFEILR